MSEATTDNPAAEQIEAEAQAMLREMEDVVEAALIAIQATIVANAYGPFPDTSKVMRSDLLALLRELATLRAANAKLREQQCPIVNCLRAADEVALAAFDLIERHVIQTRTRLSDALEVYADNRFDVVDGSGIAKLRGVATGQGAFPPKESK